jgi:hypothetical protein
MEQILAGLPMYDQSEVLSEVVRLFQVGKLDRFPKWGTHRYISLPPMPGAEVGQ